MTLVTKVFQPDDKDKEAMKKCGVEIFCVLNNYFPNDNIKQCATLSILIDSIEVVTGCAIRNSITVYKKDDKQQ